MSTVEIVKHEDLRAAVLTSNVRAVRTLLSAPHSVFDSPINDLIKEHILQKWKPHEEILNLLIQNVEDFNLIEGQTHWGSLNWKFICRTKCTNCVISVIQREDFSEIPIDGINAGAIYIARPMYHSDAVRALYARAKRDGIPINYQMMSLCFAEVGNRTLLLEFSDTYEVRFEHLLKLCNKYMMREAEQTYVEFMIAHPEIDLVQGYNQLWTYSVENFYVDAVKYLMANETVDILQITPGHGDHPLKCVLTGIGILKKDHPDRVNDCLVVLRLLLSDPRVDINARGGLLLKQLRAVDMPEVTAILDEFDTALQ